MKLKRQPEDFQVEEQSDFAVTGDGPFALYLLEKRGLGTPEAVRAIARRWRVNQIDISFGGLKDRHAITKQFLTIHRGPRRNLNQTNLSLKYLGQAARPFQSSDIAGNRFMMVLRAMQPDQVAGARDAIEAIRRDGFPNYFDDQRFGSLGDSNEFAARAWIAGDYERTLWLALADTNSQDRSRDREEKRFLREHWGDWMACAARLQSGDRAGVARFLASRPNDYRGAITRISPQQRSLLLGAFQSYLWNRLLADFIRDTCPLDRRFVVRLRPGDVPFFSSLDHANRERLAAAAIPLPSARLQLDGSRYEELVRGSVAELGLALREIRVKYPRDSYFAKGERSAICTPRDTSFAVADDELYPRQKKLTVRLVLPRGAYATIAIKRIAASAGSPAADSAELEDLEHAPIEAAT